MDDFLPNLKNLRVTNLFYTDHHIDTEAGKRGSPEFVEQLITVPGFSKNNHHQKK
jgi:hypothetical protein